VIRLGRATTTYDREGESVGPERDVAGIRHEDVEAAAEAFRGEFLQSPPAYSAKKVGGRKFYEMARKGESVPVVPKKVRVSELTFGELKDGRLPFTISCSSGTYIRSIASELGEKLGCGAHLESLRRTRIGQFHASDAATLEAFEAMTPAERMAPPHAVSLSRVQFPFERVRLASLETWKIRKGQSIPARGVASREGDWVALVGPSDEMVALGQVTPMGNRGVALIRPKLVLAE
jgi:tRNA pseudouridine55 synthase